MSTVQHVEFFDKEHFDKYYHRTPPQSSLKYFIDFFWETRFESLWQQHPKGFSDALFPNVGYTYLINLGTPFIMQVGDKKFKMKTDGFLPRHTAIECYHQPDNKIFGIKFRISPVLMEKKINFSEYREYIFPLSYLIEPSIIEQVKHTSSFEARIKILSAYFDDIIKRSKNSLQPVQIVTDILKHCSQQNDFSTSIETYAAENNISTRTLQRYFEMTTGISSKKVIQILRIRKAAEHLANSPKTFHYSQYGYYDHSHFYKHLKQFLKKSTLEWLKPHILLLETLHK